MYLATNMKRIQFIINCLAECENLNKKAYFLLDEDNDQYDFTSFDTLSVHYFNQLWSNTGCGWGGVVGSAFSYSQNFIAINKTYGVAFVFINRYAYTCKTDDLFYEAFNKQEMPGYEERNKLNIIDLKN